MIHVTAVLGQAAWIARTTGTAWQVSPIADNRMTQTAAGGSLKGVSTPMLEAA
jgi:hypothetical protein